MIFKALGISSETVKLTNRQKAQLHRYSLRENLLYYQVDKGDEPRLVVPNDEDLRHRILYEAHDVIHSGHLGREKTFTSVAGIIGGHTCINGFATMSKHAKRASGSNPHRRRQRRW